MMKDSIFHVTINSYLVDRHMSESIDATIFI